MGVKNIEAHGGRDWVPWLGLSMVLPAVIVLMVGVFTFLFSTRKSEVVANEGSGLGAGVLLTISVLIGLMLATVGIVRAYRKPARQSVGLEGMALEIGVLVIAIVTLGALIISIF
jgi:hypothetical protein